MSYTIIEQVLWNLVTVSINSWNNLTVTFPVGMFQQNVVIRVAQGRESEMYIKVGPQV